MRPVEAERNALVINTYQRDLKPSSKGSSGEWLSVVEKKIVQVARVFCVCVFFLPFPRDPLKTPGVID